MKERENRRVGYVQTTTLLAMSINRYLCISLYCFVFPLPGFFGFGRIWAPPRPKQCKGRLSLAKAPQDRIS